MRHEIALLGNRVRSLDTKVAVYSTKAHLLQPFASDVGKSADAQSANLSSNVSQNCSRTNPGPEGAHRGLQDYSCRLAQGG